MNEENKLLTLSAIIDNEQEILDKMEAEKVDEGEYYVQEMNAWQTVSLANLLLKQTFEIWQFVPCKDGKPIKKPAPLPKKNHSLDSKKQYMRACDDYREASKLVIFEGFKLIQTGETCYICNKSWGLDWCGKNDSLRLYPVVGNSFGFRKNLLADRPTLADLAAATSDNPITLKTNN